MLKIRKPKHLHPDSSYKDLIMIKLGPWSNWSHQNIWSNQPVSVNGRRDMRERNNLKESDAWCTDPWSHESDNHQPRIFFIERCEEDDDLNTFFVRLSWLPFTKRTITFEFHEVGPLAHRPNTTCLLLLAHACDNGFKTWVTQIGPQWVTQIGPHTIHDVYGQGSMLPSMKDQSYHLFVIDWQLSTLNLGTGFSATTIGKSSGPPDGPSYSKGRMGCEGNLVERWWTLNFPDERNLNLKCLHQKQESNHPSILGSPCNIDSLIRYADLTDLL